MLGRQYAAAYGSPMSIRRPIVCLMVLLAGPLLPAFGADRQIVGHWLATEFDPFIPENPLFGQYRYTLDIVDVDGGYQIHIARSGATLQAGPLDGDRLTAHGDDPNRGPLALDVRVGGGRLEGTLSVKGREKRITAQLAPEDQLAKVSGDMQAALTAANAAKSRETGLQQRTTQLNARIAELERQLAGSEAARQASEHALARAQDRLHAEPPTPVAVPASSPPPGPAREATATASGSMLTIDIIDPPGIRDGARITVPVLAQREIVGRISGPVRVFSASINGAPLRFENNGLFRTDIVPDNGEATLSIVAVDRDGRRAALRFALVAAAPPATASAGPPGPKSDRDRDRCYRMAIAAKPDQNALSVCRRAMAAEDAGAIDHYNLAVALSRMGRHAEALAAYRDAAALWSR